MSVRKILPREVLSKINGTMREHGYTQEDIAQLLGKKQTTVSKKILGVSPMTRAEFEKILTYLELPDLRRYLTLFEGAEDAWTGEQDRGVDALTEALRSLSPRDRQEFYLVAAIVLEAKLPRAQWKVSRMLRTMAHATLTVTECTADSVTAHDNLP